MGRLRSSAWVRCSVSWAKSRPSTRSLSGRGSNCKRPWDTCSKTINAVRVSWRWRARKIASSENRFENLPQKSPRDLCHGSENRFENVPQKSPRDLCHGSKNPFENVPQYQPGQAPVPLGSANPNRSRSQRIYRRPSPRKSPNLCLRVHTPSTSRSGIGHLKLHLKSELYWDPC